MKNKHFKLGIWGWWQGGNLGDNWIKNIMKKAFPFARCIPTNILKFRGFDFIICGGGGLFIYDVIRPWNTIEKIKQPFGIIGMGAEFPHTSDLAKKLDDKAEFFFVRDDYSIECMGLGQKNKSFDATFIEPLEWCEKQELDSDKLFFVWRDGHELLENDQFHKYICYEDTVNETWQDIIHRNFTTIIEDDFQTTEADVEERIKGCGFVITGRFHGVVAAIQKGIPFIAIDICPKIRMLADDAGLSEYCVKISETHRIDELIEKARNNIDEIRQKEKQYTLAAHEVMSEHVNVAYEAIFRTCKPMRALSIRDGKEESQSVEKQLEVLRGLCTVKEKAFLTGFNQSGQGQEAEISLRDIKKIVPVNIPDVILIDGKRLKIEKSALLYLQQKQIAVIDLSDEESQKCAQDTFLWTKRLRKELG